MIYWIKKLHTCSSISLLNESSLYENSLLNENGLYEIQICQIADLEESAEWMSR